VGDLAAVTINERPRHDAPIRFVEYDKEWPVLFEQEAQRIRAALGARVLLLEHAGSTSVPGLAAKPVIDIVLAVSDSSNEDDYVPALEPEGYELRIREPDWYEHRMLKKPAPNVQLHVFSVGCVEIDRMLAFRDHLRSNDADRELYERTKRELGAQHWEYVQDYADAKSDVVEAIIARALA
jgi:GrpB-like predicted nucleotidyltransferase (UPF0157 family)